MTHRRMHQRFGAQLIAGFAVLAAIILSSGLLYYRNERQSAQEQARRHLTALADSKTAQIANWLRERFDDARLGTANAPVMPGLSRAAKAGAGGAARDSVQMWLGGFIAIDQYESAILFDATGVPRASAGRIAPTPALPRSLLDEVLQSSGAVLQDLHARTSGSICLGIAVALRERPGDPPFGILLLEIDPAKFLFPAMRSWPVESTTGEAVLVRRDGADALVLNNTRHRDDAALRLRIPLQQAATPAAQAAVGHELTMTGADYRGVPVFAVTRRIPGSPWSLVAKIDESEVEQPLRDQAGLLAISLVSFLAASALLAILLWRQRYASLLQRRHTAEIEKLRLKSSYDYLSRYANDVILLLDENLNVLDVNDKACAVYGYDRETFLRMCARDLRAPESLADLEDRARVLREQGGAIYETQHRRSDGATFPVEVSSRGSRVDGKLYFQAIIRDISEREQFERRLRETNEQLRAFIDSAPVGIAAIDAAGIVTHWNPAAERISGYPSSRMLGHHNGESPGFLFPLRLGQPNGIRDLSWTRADGAVIALSISSAPLPGKDGHPAGDIVMFVDVTDQRTSMTAIRERDHYLQGLFAAAPMAVISVDSENNVVTWNKGAESLFGWTAGEVVGFPLSVVPDDQQEALHDAKRRMRTGEVVRNLESRRLRKDGSFFDSSSDAAGLFDDQGELTGHIVFVQDITARKIAEEALAASEAKFRSLFEAAGDAIVIHDLEGSILELNQAACSLMGATREELLGRTPPYLVAPTTASGDKSFFESLHRHADGSLTAIEVNTRRLAFAGRAAALSLIRDVSSRKQAEEDLRQANESLSTIIHTSPAAIVSRDTAARVLSWNRGAELLFGWTAEEAIGTTLPFIEDEQSELLQAIRGRIGEGVSLSGFEHELRHREGHTLQISISTAPFHDPEGNIAGEIAIVLDVSPKHQALATLRESEARFRTVFDQPAAGMALCDFEGRLVHFNSRFCQITGYTADELLGKAVMDITHPDDRPGEAELAESLMREEVSTYAVEKRYVRPDGSTVWVNVTASLMRNPDGIPTEVFGVVEDIAARKEAESRQKLLTDTISASHDEIYLFDAGTLRYRFVNQGGLRNLGYTFEQMTRLTPLDITASYTPESMRAALQPLLDGDLPVLVTEARHVRADGTTYPVEVHLQVFCPDGDRVFLAVIQDTTARQRAEQVLRESEARFRQVVESAPEAIFVATDSRFRYLNPNALRLFGATSEQDLIGSVTFDRIHPDFRPAAAERSRAIATQGAAAPPLEEVFLRLDGSSFDVEVAAVPFIHEGQPGGLIFFRDISARKRQQQEHQRMEEMLRQSQKMESIGRLAGGVAHDFNNHLTVINGFSELVLEQIGHDSPLHQPVSEIRKSGERAAAITRQLLAFSRKQILAPQSLDLNALIRDLSNMLRRLLGEDIAFRTHLEPGLGAIVADSSQMSQILMNLCVNARDAMPHGGSLTITTAAGLTSGGKPTVNLAISDSGSGIDEATLPRIFEPFFTTKDPGVGTGLGLATVHGVVEQSGGAIRVESAVGVGTTFHLTFPAVAITDTPMAPDVSTPARGSETVLLVEDQREVRLLARALLMRQGYNVLEAPCGEDALTLAASYQGRISLLVTDVIMPGCTGPELARLFSGSRPGVPILFMSGYDAGSLDPDAAHIAKPFTPNAFVAKVRELLDAAPPPADGP